MKIVEHSIHAIKVPYKRIVQWGSFSEDGADIVVLKLVADSGHAGVAEATTKPLWSGVTAPLLVASLEQIFMPLIGGIDFDDEVSVDRAIGNIPDNRAAKGLIHSAFWDLRAAIAQKPLWRQWGGIAKVPLSWTLSRQAPSAMAREAGDMVESYDFTALKMKGGQGPDTDFAALAEIRRAIGDSIDIYVDVNQYYDRKTSLRYVREMADRGVKLVEDPYPLQPDEEFRAFQEQCPIPILVDTHCTASADARAFLAHGAQAISLKPGRLGLTEARRCAVIADGHRAHTVVGLFAESDIGTLNSAQLASTRTIDGSGLPAEISFFLMMRESLLAVPLRADNGILLLPDSPSIAELVDWSKVKRLQRN